jgi:hypothetical protein
MGWACRWWQRVLSACKALRCPVHTRTRCSLRERPANGGEGACFCSLHLTCGLWTLWSGTATARAPRAGREFKPVRPRWERRLPSGPNRAPPLLVSSAVRQEPCQEGLLQ